MANEHKSGQPWSGTNKIPTVSQFISNLDKDKKARDEKIAAGGAEHGVQVKNQDILPHKNAERMKDATSVQDPVTGGQVMISDVGKEHMDNAINPKVSNTKFGLSHSLLIMWTAISSKPEPGQAYYCVSRFIHEES